MDISIIILNYHSSGLVKYCLNNIKESNPKASCEFIVVNNSPHDGCKEMLAQDHPDVLYIENEKNLGFGAGNNVGIASAQGEHVMVLNPDVTMLSGAIDTLIEYLKNNPRVGMVGPKLFSGDRSVQRSCYRFPSLFIAVFRRTFLGKLPRGKRALHSFLMEDFDHNRSQAVDWLQGSCIVVPRNIIDTLGMFDERYFMYVEDMDWCRRIWKAEHEVHYVADAHMYHLHNQESASYNMLLKFVLNKTTRWHISSWIKYFVKYRGEKLPHQVTIN